MGLVTKNVSPDTVQSSVRRIRHHRIVERIWQHDHTVWQPSDDEIANRLGWLHLPDAMRPRIPGIKQFVDGVRADGFRSVLLLGMGGSSLAAETYAASRRNRQHGIPLTILDSTHPDAVRDAARALDIAHTLFIVATKSGATAETLALYRTFYGFAAAVSSSGPTGTQFVAITDPGSPLLSTAETYGFRQSFTNDPNLGGRYSALSLYGLVPAALLGFEIAELLDDAEAFASRCSDAAPEANDTARLGALLGTLARNGADKATFVLPEPIRSLGPWVEQLIAESTGKHGVGILPVIDEPLAGPHAYGSDRVFIVVNPTDLDADRQTALGALDEAGFPILAVEAESPWSLGREFFRWQFATAVAAHILGVNPFDQPNVESAKQATRAVIDDYQGAGRLPSIAASMASARSLEDLLRHVTPPEYVSLQAYVPPSATFDKQLAALRQTLRDRYRVATTAGYGPRFLHSTGQLHKGDAGGGRFVQFVSDETVDMPIPDVAGQTGSSLSFSALIRAQAAGDRRALLDAGRRVTTLRLSNHPATDLLRASESLRSERATR